MLAIFIAAVFVQTLASCSNAAAPTGTNELKGNPVEGAIIMKDGSLKHPNFFTGKDKDNAIAVIYKIENGKVWAVGKVHEKAKAQWAKEGTDGEDKEFTGLVTTITRTPGMNFSGYTDGSNGLSTLRGDVSDYNLNSGNYSAWEWVEKYGATNCAGAFFTSGWYLPSITELYDIFVANTNNSRIIESALAKCGGDNFGADTYWSSSHKAGEKKQSYGLDFAGSVDICVLEVFRKSHLPVCAVRVFTY